MINLRQYTGDIEKYSNGSYIKVNLPDSEESHCTGNGEGVFAIPLTADDNKTCMGSKVGEKFEVIICNDSFYYSEIIFRTIVTVEIVNKKFRPILDEDTHKYLT